MFHASLYEMGLSTTPTLPPQGSGMFQDLVSHILSM